MKEEGHVWATCRYIDDPGDAKDVSALMAHIGKGPGGWNAMTPQRWYFMGGYDERMKGWGHEDSDLHKRIIQRRVRTRVIDDMPLLHVRHDKREWFTKKGHEALAAQQATWLEFAEAVNQVLGLSPS